MAVEWFRSSHCADGACVEVSTSDDGVGLRDSKHPAKRLVLGPDQWAAFIAGIKAGELTEPR
jgi:predicted secreted Zn-dependent protease